MISPDQTHARHMRRRTGGDGPRLAVTVERRVRFEELDPMGIVWHGRYASWLEDGREAMGERYGISYQDFRDHGVVLPLKTFNLDFRNPLRYGEPYFVHAMLLWSEAALLDYEYSITDAQNRIMTSARTTQLMLTLEGKLLLDQPVFFQNFRRRWQAGELA